MESSKAPNLWSTRVNATLARAPEAEWIPLLALGSPSLLHLYSFTSATHFHMLTGHRGLHVH